MKLQEHYDCIILGDSPPSLFAAAMLAKWDLSVLCLSLFPSYGIQTSRSGMIWDPERNRVPWTPLLQKWLSEDFLKATTLGFEEGDQLLTPTLRLTCPSDEKEWMRLLGEEFGNDWSTRYGFSESLGAMATKIREYWTHFPKEGSENELEGKRKSRSHSDPLEFRKRLDFPNALKRSPWGKREGLLSDLCTLHPSREAYEYFRGVHALLSNADSPNPSLHSILEGAALQSWVTRARGGVSTFRTFLKDVARKCGAHLPKDAKVHRLFIEDGKFIGAQLENRGRLIGANGGILGCSIMQARHRFFFAGKESHVKLQPVPEPRGWIFTVAIQMDAGAVPPGASRFLVWSEEGAPALELEFANVEDYHRVDQPQVLLFLRTRLPFQTATLHPHYQIRIASRMFRKARDLLPYLEYSIVSMYPELRPFHGTEFDQVAELGRLYPFVGLDDIPENLRVFPTESDPAFGSAGFDTGIEGLSLATQESYPELGPVSGWVAAIQSINKIAEQVKGRWSA